MDRRNLLKGLVVSPLGAGLLQAIESPEFGNPDILPLPDGFLARSSISGTERFLQATEGEDGWEFWQGEPVVLRILLSEYEIQDLPDHPLLWAAVDGVRIEDPSTHLEVLETVKQVRDQFCAPGSSAWDEVSAVNHSCLNLLGISVNSQDLDKMDERSRDEVARHVCPDFFGYKRQEGVPVHRVDLLPARYYDLGEKGEFDIEFLKEHRIDE